MYSHITGKLVSKLPVHVVIDVAGVGYALNIPLSTYEKLPEKGSRVRLLTHLHVREDDLSLYGFAAKEELETFKLLIGVSGIGPKLAISILSGGSVGHLSEAVATGDVDRLTAFKGIGRKTAQRLIVELRDKFAAANGDMSWMSPTGESAESANVSEAIAALEALGFTKKSAHEVVKKTVNSLGVDTPPGDLVRESLRNI